MNTQQTLEQALEIAKQRLSLFATDPEFLSKMQVAFGETWETNQGITFGQAWQTADFSIISPIEIRPAADINGASGGYAGATNTIYISAEFLSQNATNLEPVTRVLLEEIGHAVDWQLNEYDTPGDEGAIFSALASGAVLSEAQLAQLRLEDDTAVVSLDGQNLQIQQAVPIHPDDYAALQALYNSTDGANWTYNNGWRFSNPSPDAWVVDGWNRVNVDTTTGRVTHLRLGNNNLSGTIPPELGNLSSLQVLWLEGNDLSGTIPPELGNLSSLQSLYLFDNTLSGSIPPELGNLSSLHVLYLEGNDLSGTIPPELGNLSSLQGLGLNNNNLSGTIPPDLGNLSSLQLLWLQSNSLSGPVPESVNNLLPSLTDYDLGDLLTGATLSINDTQLAEGNNGTTNAIFTVTLSESATETVTVNYTTADDTAIAGEDYTATTGTLTFNPGETEKTITVPIIGDTEVEPDETFKVTLSNPTGATLADSEAIGTILNDDNPTSDTQIFWRDYSTGNNALWYMNGTEKISSAELPSQSDWKWRLMGAADFNGDENPDLLWRHSDTAESQVWLMNGTTDYQSVTLSAQDSNWQLRGIGDFNGDKKPDLVWHHLYDGATQVWLMNGTQKTDILNLPSQNDSNWTLRGTGDFNNDGLSDLLWRHQTNGSNQVWLMNPTDISTDPEVVSLPTQDNDWQLNGTSDLNDDGKPDLLWHNPNTGENQAWIMDGTTQSSIEQLPLAESNMEMPLHNFLPVSVSVPNPEPVGPPAAPAISQSGETFLPEFALGEEPDSEESDLEESDLEESDSEVSEIDDIDFENPNHILSYGSLMLKIAEDKSFNLDQQGNFFLSDGYVQMGLNPTAGEAFKPLMTFSVHGGFRGHNGNISANGSVIANIDGKNELLFYGTFDIDPGKTETSEIKQEFAFGEPAIDIAGCEIYYDKLSFVNPNGGSTADSHLLAEGEIFVEEELEYDFKDWLNNSASATVIEQSQQVPVSFSQNSHKSPPVQFSQSSETQSDRTILLELSQERAPEQPTVLEYVEGKSLLFKPDNSTTFDIEVSYPDAKQPVLVLPGVMGSYIDRSKTATDWSLNRGLHPTELQIDPILDSYNDLLETLKNFGYTPGEDLFAAPYDWRLPPFPDDGTADGKISSLSAGLVTDEKYEHGVDYLGYWLKQAAEKWYEKHGTALKSVNVIAHSTGGLVTRGYIQSDAYGGTFSSPLNDGKLLNLPKIDNFIMVGVPNLGAPKIWNMMNDDWNTGAAESLVVRNFLNAAYQKLAQNGINGPNQISLNSLKGVKDSAEHKQDFIEQYAPTIRALSPTYPFIKTNGDEHLKCSDEVDAAKQNTFLLDLNYSGDNDKWVKKLTQETNLTVVYGTDSETTTSVTQKTGTLLDVVQSAEQFVSPSAAATKIFSPIQSFTDTLPREPDLNEVFYEETKNRYGGDGTVPVESSFGAFEDNAVKTQKFSNVKHGDLPSDTEVQQFIVKTIIGKEELTPYEKEKIKGTSWWDGKTSWLNDRWNEGKALLLNLDPVEGFVVDANGNRLGYSEATGPVTEIPNSTWFGDTDGFGFVFGEVDTPVKLDLTGLGEDHYVQVSLQQGNQVGGIESTGFLAPGEKKELDIELTEIVQDPSEDTENHTPIIGTDVSDTLSGSEGYDTILGMSADDYLLASGSNNFLNGNVGDDTVEGGNGNDTIHGGKDNDTLMGHSENDILCGDLGDDFLNGNQGNDTLYGCDDKDTLHGGQGNDFLLGGTGNDSLCGDLGNDFLNGNEGDDILNGGDGDDTLHGGKDNDILLGGTGNDSLCGDLGNDFLNGNQGDDTLLGGDGDDSLYGGKDQDSLSGGAGNDLLCGDLGNDTLSGEENNDTLQGGGGNDLLSGDAGNDILIGVNPDAPNSEPEIDTLTGGEGADTFVLGDATIAYYIAAGGDDYALITDFDLNADMLQLHGRSTDYRIAELSKVIGHYSGLEGEQEIVQTDAQIFRTTNGQDELIGVVQGVANLSLDSGAFSFV